MSLKITPKIVVQSTKKTFLPYEQASRSDLIIFSGGSILPHLLPHSKVNSFFAVRVLVSTSATPWPDNTVVRAVVSATPGPDDIGTVAGPGVQGVGRRLSCWV